MKLLITGACGFVGSTLAESWLAAQPDAVIHGMDNFSRPGSEYNRLRLQELGVKLRHADVRVASDFEGLPSVDYVIDAAANPSVLAGVDGQVSSRQLVEHNLQGTINVLEFCKRASAGFILLSTSRVYSIPALAGIDVEVVGRSFRPRPDQAFPAGLSGVGIAETFSTAPPLSLYGTTKLASEVLALEYGEAFGFPVWINRCGTLAGAGQFGKPDQGIFSYWIHSWMARQPLKYIGFGGVGHQVRDCFHPRDLVSLLLQQTRSADSSRPKTVNIGGGLSNAMSLADISQWCADRFGLHEVQKDERLRKYDLPWVVMDSSLARQSWNWTPQTSLTEILSQIAVHAQNHPDWLEISGGA